jgi:glycerol-3-phosphate dehydrogenase (NAD(P)+)
MKVGVMLKNSVCVIGAGKWGQAIWFAMHEKNKDVYITSRTKRDIENFISLKEAFEYKYLVIAIPAQEIRAWLEKNYKYQEGQKILVASKGIEASTGEFLNTIYRKFIPKENLAFLSGPSFAVEVKQSLPTALVINSLCDNTSSEFATFFPNFIKTYYSNDVIGAEICGAYKNVLAIASGICKGLELGENAKASLISRGLVEMNRFGKFFGAKDDTFMGLSGAGDLFLTANSELSRNFRVGLGLAKNKTLDDILQELGEVAEGVKTSYAIDKIAKMYNIYTPIATEVRLILDGKKPLDSLKDLLR